MAERFTAEFREQNEKAASDLLLVDLLGRMEAKRKEHFAIDEVVQSITMGADRGRFTSLRSAEARFAWEAPNRYFADVSGTMRLAAFRLGSDGTNWWWHIESERRNRLVACPVAEMHQINESLCAPFGEDRTGLHYHGTRDGALVISKWSVELYDFFVSVTRTEWHIDLQTLQAREVIQYHDGLVHREHFLHRTVNSPIPREAFLPPPMTVEAVEPLEEGYTILFVNIRDGSDGRMSVRWGKQGPKASRAAD